MNQLQGPAGQNAPRSLANRGRGPVMQDMVTGLGMVRPAHISIRGGKFTLVNAAGAEYLWPTHHIDLIVIDANVHTSRLYYGGSDVPYDPTSSDPPICFSDNGTGPSNQSMEPQAPTCVVCPWNVRGSDTTFTGKSTTACTKNQKLAVMLPGDPAVNVYEFKIPPGSLSNLKAYHDYLSQQVHPQERRAIDVADVVTRVQFDPERPFVMFFEAVGWIDSREVEKIFYIDDRKLADVAVGRTDIAVDPGMVRLAAPAQPAQQQQTSGFTLPAYAPTAPASPAPAAHVPAPGQGFQPQAQFQPQQHTPNFQPGQPAQQQLAPPPPPAAPKAPRKPRTPRQPAQQQTTAGATQAAPFMAPAQQQQAPQPQAQGNSFSGAPAMEMPPIPDFLQRGGQPQPGPGTRLQEPANYNPAPQPQFGMQGGTQPPAGLAEQVAQAWNLPTA